MPKILDNAGYDSQSWSKFFVLFFNSSSKSQLDKIYNQKSTLFKYIGAILLVKIEYAADTKKHT